MEKIKYKLKLKTSELEEVFSGEGEKENNKLVLFDGKDVLEIDLENDLFHRQSEEVTLYYSFIKEKKTLGTIYIKELDQSLKIDILTNNIIKNNNRVVFDFEILNNDKFLIEVEYEVVK